MRPSETQSASRLTPRDDQTFATALVPYDKKVTAIPAISAAHHADVYVERLRIENFRGITSCELELEPTLTILVGRNNVGKSRVLSALHLALGGRIADVDDFTVGSTALPTIDVVLAPVSPSSAAADEEFTTAVAQRLGSRAAQPISDQPFRERFAWRTRVRRSAEGLGARSEFKVLIFNDTSGRWEEQANAADVTRNQRSLLSSDLVNTGRDLMEDLARRGSSVRKVLSDLGVDDAARAVLETDLVNLSNAIVAGSDTLQAVTSALVTLNQSVGSIGSPAINPLPISLEELARSLSIDLDTGAGALPIRLHGAGARSLASLQIQGVLYERLLGADGGAIRPHPVTLVEEPEAHLHPQGCAEIPHLLRAITGQVVASTHSSEIVTEVEPRSIRLLRPAAGGLVIIDLGPADSDQTATHRAFRPSQHTAEMEKLKRLAERPFGEILFSSAIVLGDGATERALLPPLLRHALGARAHGLCVIDPESLKSDVAKAAIKFAEMTNLPWFAIADSDDAGRNDVKELTGSSNRQQSDTIIWNGKADSTAPNGRTGATEAMLVDFDAQLAKDACELVRPDMVPVSNILKSMSKLKGSIGVTLAGLMIQRHPDHTKWPAPLQELISKLSAVLP